MFNCLKRFVSLTALILVLFSCNSTLDAEISVTLPTAGSPYFSYSNIQTEGTTDMGVDVWVRLQLNGATGASATVTVPPQDTDWDHDFSAPGSGWTKANSWKCEVYDDSDKGTVLDDVTYSVI